MLYISRRNGKSSEQQAPIPKEHPDLSVLMMRVGFILRKNIEKGQCFPHPIVSSPNIHQTLNKHNLKPLKPLTVHNTSVSNSDFAESDRGAGENFLTEGLPTLHTPYFAIQTQSVL